MESFDNGIGHQGLQSGVAGALHSWHERDSSDEGNSKGATSFVRRDCDCDCVCARVCVCVCVCVCVRDLSGLLLCLLVCVHAMSLYSCTNRS